MKKYELNEKSLGLAAVVLGILLAFISCQLSGSGADLADYLIAGATNFSATPNASAASMALSWTASAQATGYRLLRSTSDANYKTLIDTTGTSYTDTGLAADLDYWYSLVATTKDGKTSTGVKAAMSLSGFPAPVGFAVTDSDTTWIKFKWSEMSGAMGYQLYRSTDGTTFSELAKATGTTNYVYYTDESLNVNTSYWYQVSAYSASLSGKKSAVLATRTKDGLGAPTNLKAKARTGNSITIGWDAVNSASYYRVYRSTNGNNFSQIGQIGNNPTEFTDNNLTIETNYWYKVSANAYSNTLKREVESFSTVLMTSTMPVLRASVVKEGQNHVLVLKEDGTVWAWGENSSGQVGIGNSTTYQNSLVQIMGLSGITAIEPGDNFSLALKNDGSVWAWGENSNGQLGKSDFSNSYTPVQIVGLDGILAISAGSNHALALKSDGTVWAWGNNSTGQLGDGTFSTRTTVSQIAGISGIVSISAGSQQSFALDGSGTLFAWGSEPNGEFGNGTSMTYTTPTNIATGITGAKISIVNFHTLLLKSDGTVYSTGLNNNGQLGDGTTTSRSAFQKLSDLSSITKISAGNWHSAALGSNGAVWVWGYNEQGQLGNGSTQNVLLPIQLLNISNVASIYARYSATIMVKTDGTVWGIGGLPGRQWYYTPTQVTGQ